MHGCKTTWTCLWLSSVIALCVAASVTVADGEASQTLPETLLADAALTDVCFIDAANGWAVGERGVIWHTVDGGATWQLQRSPVECRLDSVFFLDQRQGWAVGGANRPYGQTTVGIVLSTDDGGATWTAVPNLVLPALGRVRFFDADHGVAIGCRSAAAPAGVFATQDGGRTWQSLATESGGDWRAGDFVDVQTGAVAGAAGRTATVLRGRVGQSTTHTSTLRSLHAMRLVAPTGGWLVGDGGLVMTTGDLGHSWQTPPTELPTNAGDHFDFYAVAVHGQYVWIAGTPGTRVFHSPDGGRSWQAFATGNHAPIRAITFVSAECGWAVGEMGTILATRDGGRTWQAQRAGGRRAALWAALARPSDVPVELIAAEGAAEGYLVAVDFVHSATGDDRSRAREAMVLAGATSAETAWRFPLPPDDLALGPDELLAALDRANDGRAIERLQSYLVRQLRMWRPDVVLTRRVPHNGGDTTAALVEQLVLWAIEAAADPTQYVELASEAGLGPWQVSKVYGLLPPEVRGDELVSTSRFNSRLGGTPADWSAPARRLLYEEHTPPINTLELTMLLDRTEAKGGRGVFAGVALAPGGEARRRLADLPAGDPDELRRLAMRRRHIQELLERNEGNAAWAAQVANLTRELAADARSELLFQLAEGYRQRGRLDLAADTYYLLARNAPEHPLAEPALAWLVQFYASSEAAHRSAARGATNVRGAELAGAQEGAAGEVRQAAAIGPVAPAVGLSRDDRLRRAVQLGEYLETARPALYAEPSVRFPLVAAQRELGYVNPARRYFIALRQLPERDPWRMCADTERWLSEPTEQPPPKPLAHCQRADERPHLDGVLDEPFWQSADRLRLKGTGDAASDVRLAYDREFLYIAVRAAKVAGGDYQRDDRPRPRDADLTPHDRISLRLDIDRDYATCFELTVDHRGWTHDACWGDATWNPTWFVAAADDDESWTIEAAIPLAELATNPPDTRHVWAVAVRRTIPQVGYQSWAGDAADAESPDQFGLLIFE